MLRVVDFGSLFEQPFHDVALVVNRELDGDARQFVEALRRCLRQSLAMLEKAPDHFVTMKAVTGKDQQNREIRNQNRPVKKDQVMNAGKGIVEKAIPHQ